MKKVLLFIAAIVVISSCSNKGYTIKGSIKGEGIKDGMAVYLTNIDRKAPIRDTAELVNGAFIFKGVVEHPEVYHIYCEEIDENITIFLENDNFVVEGEVGSFEDAKISGGESQNIMNKYNCRYKELKKGLLGDSDALIEEYRAPQTTAQRKEEIIELFNKLQEESEALKDSLIKAYPNSYFALSTLEGDMRDMEIGEVEAKLAEFKLNPRFSKHKTIGVIEKFVTSEKALQIGCVAPDFTLPDPNGNGVKLSDIYPKGKVTMIDFWAGWCNPCRRFNPTLVEIYKKYHKKGFEILGVSLDRDEKQWLDAIKTDKLTWTQVSELKFWNSEVVKLYNVNYIPQNVFVDSEGKIIARRASEEEIEELLEKYLK